MRGGVCDSLVAERLGTPLASSLAEWRILCGSVEVWSLCYRRRRNCRKAGRATV